MKLKGLKSSQQKEKILKISQDELSEERWYLAGCLEGWGREVRCLQIPQ